MKHNKKLISAILLISMLAAASCGSSDAQSDDSGSGSETSSAARKEYTVPDVDYGGRTVTMTGYDYDEVWVILNYNVALEEENGDVINDAIVMRNRAVEEALNVNIELIPLGKNDRTSFSVLQKYILAQEDAVQVGMQMGVGLSVPLTTEGMVVDLNDIPTLDLSNPWWNQKANEEYTLYGKQLTAIGDISLFNLGSPVVVFFSKNMIEDNKLENPYQLVYDGKWTLDSMMQMASAAARDINGNTEADDDDIYGFAGENDTIVYSAYASGIKLSQRDSSGNLQASLNTEKTINLAEKFVPFMRNERTVMYRSGSSIFTDLFMPKLMNNELLFFSNQLHVALNLRAMESDFGILPLPKYDEAQADYISFGNGYFSDHIVVPATNSDLEMTGNFLDAMGYYAKEYITPAFIDVSVKDKGARDEDSVNMINIILENQIFDVGYIFNWGKSRSVLNNLVANNDTGFSSAWASIEPAVQAALADTVKMLKGE